MHRKLMWPNWISHIATRIYESNNMVWQQQKETQMHVIHKSKEYTLIER
jgi:hypothetical protein